MVISSMTERRVAIRYAKSILELAEEKAVLEQVQQDMAFFAKTLDENPLLRAVIRNPIVHSFRKLTILKKIFADQFHPITINFFEIIARKNREEILYQTAKEFQTLYEERKGVLRVTLTSTVPLQDTVKQKAIQIVQKATGKQVKLEEKINPALIGGFTITFGNDNQIDASIRTKLKLLEKEFLQ